MEHYWTEPIKLTFKWIVDKRDLNGNTLESKEFTDKIKADSFLSQKNYYINGVLTHSAN